MNVQVSYESFLSLQRPSLVKELVNARITLKNIETLTYNFTEMEYDHAKTLASDLEQLYSKYQALLPKCQGLILQPKSNMKIQYMRRKVQKARLALKCSSLPRKKSRSSKGPFVRVGSKAERLQKVFLYHHKNMTSLRPPLYCISGFHPEEDIGKKKN